MKTSLAVVLAVAALISGATVSLNPGTASAQTLAQIWCTKGCLRTFDVPPPPRAIMSALGH